MIRRFFTFELLLEWIAGTEVNASRADHLFAKAAHAPEIAWIALRFDDHDPVAVEAGERIGFLADAANIKRKYVATLIPHSDHCSSKWIVPVAVPV